MKTIIRKSYPSFLNIFNCTFSRFVLTMFFQIIMKENKYNGHLQKQNEKVRYSSYAFN